eukprot:3070649-Rhodomonas_salina.4
MWSAEQEEREERTGREEKKEKREERKKSARAKRAASTEENGERLRRQERDKTAWRASEPEKHSNRQEHGRRNTKATKSARARTDQGEGAQREQARARADLVDVAGHDVDVAAVEQHVEEQPQRLPLRHVVLRHQQLLPRARARSQHPTRRVPFARALV